MTGERGEPLTGGRDAAEAVRWATADRDLVRANERALLDALR